MQANRTYNTVTQLAGVSVSCLFKVPLWVAWSRLSTVLQWPGVQPWDTPHPLMPPHATARWDVSWTSCGQTEVKSHHLLICTSLHTAWGRHVGYRSSSGFWTQFMFGAYLGLETLDVRNHTWIQCEIQWSAGAPKDVGWIQSHYFTSGIYSMRILNAALGIWWTDYSESWPFFLDVLSSSLSMVGGTTLLFPQHTVICQRITAVLWEHYYNIGKICRLPKAHTSLLSLSIQRESTCWALD